MKHNLKITFFLIAIFVISQLFGIGILRLYCNAPETSQVCKPLPLGLMRIQIADIAPVMQPLTEKITFGTADENTENSISIALYFIILIIIGTVIMLILIRFNRKTLSKIWFCFAIFIGLSVALGSFINHTIAVTLALMIAIWKVFFPNIYINNIAEVFIYGGIAALFYLLLNIFSASLLLIGISIYDMIAVWKIKHMVTMAKFQADNKMFAGAMISYNTAKSKPIKHRLTLKKIIGKFNKKIPKASKAQTTKTAVLGGGDMAFPLLFTGAVMKAFGMPYTIMIVIGSTAALTWLLFNAKKDRFYPAMPFISTGCFIGLGIIYAIRLFLG